MNVHRLLAWKPGAGGIGGRLFRLDVRLLAAFLCMCGAQGAKAIPLTPFRYEAQAQRHCPGDTVVWLDFRKGRYYLKGQRRYALGQSGSFVCRKEAGESGYRRSLLGLR
jgi:hypothetical protein